MFYIYLLWILNHVNGLKCFFPFPPRSRKIARQCTGNTGILLQVKVEQNVSLLNSYNLEGQKCILYLRDICASPPPAPGAHDQ